MTEEQKAEEYAKNLLKDVTCNIGHLRARQINSIDIEDAWLYGYKEGFKDCEKEHEWHYVKDELPPVKKKYNGRSELVLVVSKNKQIEYAQYIEKARTWARGICAIGFEPYAWKEVELPKEIE